MRFFISLMCALPLTCVLAAETVLQEFETSFLGKFSAEVRLENKSEQDTEGTVALEFFDELGKNSLGGDIQTFSLKSGEAMTCRLTAEAPPLAWTGKVVLATAEGQALPETGSVDLENVPLTSVSQIPVTGGTGKGESDWQGQWIVSPGDEPKSLSAPQVAALGDKKFYYWRFFDAAGQAQDGAILVTADDKAKFWVNGQLISEVVAWQQPVLASMGPQLVEGRNVLAVEVENEVAFYGLAAEIRLTNQDGVSTVTGSDGKWFVATTPPAGWPEPQADGGSASPIGEVGCYPWGYLRHPGWTPLSREAEATGPRPPLDKECALPEASIGKFAGAPAIAVDGKAMSMMLHQQIQGGIPLADQERLARHGIRVILTDAGDYGWKGDGRFDYAEVDQLVGDILRVNPEAWVMLSFEMTPKWWLGRHPEAAALGPDGKTSLQAYKGAKGVFPCYVHPQWRKDIEEAVGQFIRHLGRSSYASRIVGFKVLNGITAEWMYWGSQSGDFADYNPAMVEEFARWGKENGAEEFTKKIPSPEDWEGRPRYFLDPKTDASRIAYARFFQEMVSGTLQWVAGVIKRETLGRSLVGAYYGYALTFPEAGHLTLFSGHFGLGRLLAGRDVDIFYAPTEYSFRGLGDPGNLMIPSASVNLHGKLFVSEADFRTHWSSQEVYRTKTLAETLSIMRREFALSLVTGAEIEWYDFSNRYQSGDERIVSEWEKLQTLKRSLNDDALAISPQDLAVVVGEELSMQNPKAPPMDGSHLVFHQRPELMKAGVRPHYFLQSDLGNPAMRKFRMLMVLNCWNLSPDERAALEELKSDGRTLVFVYAPGVWNPASGVDVEQLGWTTGFSFAVHRDVPLRARWKNPNIEFGLAQNALAPFAFFPEVDDGDEILAVSVGGKAAPLAARRKQEDWTSVYIGAPRLPAAVIRELARSAGVHVWSQSNDPVYPCKEALGLHAATAGKKTIVLPHRLSRVTNWLTGETVAEQANQFQFNAEEKRTYLFHFEE